MITKIASMVKIGIQFNENRMIKSKKKEIQVLLIDANIQRRNTLSARMRVAGLVVEAATGGFHALNLTENKKYDGVIVVENADDMPGKEIVGLMRQQHHDKDKFPILFLGSKKDADEVMDLMNMGANEVVMYTGNFQNLLDKLKVHLKMS